MAIDTRTVAVHGLKRDVEVLRDSSGTVHIFAQSSHDLFLAQGYISAQDRLWQLDWWRRTGRGMLSEVLGERALPSDTLARSVNFRGDWDREWHSYGPEAKDVVTAFTSGINAFITSRKDDLPQEFRYCGYAPGLWRPEDCLLRFPALRLGRGIQLKYQRALDVRLFGIEMVSRTLPANSTVPVSLPPDLQLDKLNPLFLRLWQSCIEPVGMTAAEGSNAWVVAGSRTRSKGPLLANDPHRRIEIPPVRKTFHLVAPGINVIGAAEPWLPGISIGHNESVAFGFTTIGVDQGDLIVCDLDENNGGSLRKKCLEGADVIDEEILVRGASAPHSVKIKQTSQGPVIFEDADRRTAHVLKWVGSEPGTAAYLGALRLLRVASWEQFLDGLSGWTVPVQQFLFADKHGNIGSKIAGLVPARAGFDGLFPLPDNVERYTWSGFRNFSDLPAEFNPSGDFIASANQWIEDPAEANASFVQYWAPPFRHQRIAEVLETSSDLCVTHFQRLQSDTKSLAAESLVDSLRLHQGYLSKTAIDILEDLNRWDKNVTALSIEATIFEVLLSRLARELFGDELASRADVTAILSELPTAPHELIERSILDACLDLEKTLGGNREGWAWGRLHRVTFRHALPNISWHRGPFPAAGDADTINATPWDVRNRTFDQLYGASYRQIIDCADWDASVMLNVPGESGDPSSPHYSDSVARLEECRYWPLLFSRTRVEAAAVERMLLVPVSS